MSGYGRGGVIRHRAGHRQSTGMVVGVTRSGRWRIETQGHHEALVDPVTWALVQQRLNCRSGAVVQPPRASPARPGSEAFRPSFSPKASPSTERGLEPPQLLYFQSFRAGTCDLKELVDQLRAGWNSLLAWLRDVQAWVHAEEMGG